MRSSIVVLTKEGSHEFVQVLFMCLYDEYAPNASNPNTSSWVGLEIGFQANQISTTRSFFTPNKREVQLLL